MPDAHGYFVRAGLEEKWHAELEALIPEGALERRPPIRADAQPFTLP